MQSDPLIPLTIDIRRKLKAEHKRTGMTARRLLEGRKDIPHGLLPSQISRWEHGMVREVPRIHVEYVFMVWAQMRDDAGRLDSNGNARKPPGRRHPKAGEEWIEITLEMRDQLQAVIKQSGLTIRQIVDMPDKPPELSPRMINGWLHSDSSKARKQCWEFVMSVVIKDA